MTETINIVIMILFVISAIGFFISLAYVKKTLVPMFGFLIAVNVLNVVIWII